MKYKEKIIETAMFVFENWEYNIDDLYDFKECMRSLVYCIKNKPHEIMTAIDYLSDEAEETLIKHDICPECGRALTWVNDGESHAPYEHDSGHKECSCGFSTD